MTSWQNKHPFRRVLVIGLGLMGGSFVKQLQVPGIEVFGIDIDPNTCAQVAKEQEITIIRMEELDNLPRMDLIIVTVMPTQVAAQFVQLAKYVDKSTLVIDISGIKQHLVETLQSLHIPFSYILTHPMAGREKGGYAGSVKDLFVDANFLLITDGMQVSESLHQAFIRFIEWLGTDKITYMDASTHDAHITYTSQLSHILASSLLLSADFTAQTKDTIGDSFRDLTRIANMNIPMWSQLFIENKTLLATSIDHLITELETMKAQITAGDSHTLAERLELAKVRRQAFGIKQK